MQSLRKYMAEPSRNRHLKVGFVSEKKNQLKKQSKLKENVKDNFRRGETQRDEGKPLAQLIKAQTE